MRNLLFISVCTMVILGMCGPTWAQNGPGSVIQPTPNSDVVVTPEMAPKIKTLRVDNLWVHSGENKVIVQYTTEKFNGEILKNAAEFSLDSDRSIHYKMGMLMLLKESMENDSLEVRFGFKPDTGDKIIELIVLTHKKF